MVFDYSSFNNFVKQFIISIMIGFCAKIFSIALYLVVIIVLNLVYTHNVLSLPGRSSFFIMSDNFQWNYSAKQLLLTIVIAPIIENLIFPLTDYLLKDKTIIIFLLIIGLAFTYHGGGVHGISGMGIFAILTIYFLQLKKNFSTKAAYFHSVISHASANVLALIFNLISLA